MLGKSRRFSRRSRFSLSLAQAAVEHMNHGVIECEHLLIGLFDERNGVAGQVLAELGFTHMLLYDSIKGSFPEKPEVQLDLAENTKKALESAVAEARKMSYAFIGTGHLLLGILRQERELTRSILWQLNFPVSEVYEYTRNALRRSTDPFDHVKPIQIPSIGDQIKDFVFTVLGGKSNPQTPEGEKADEGAYRRSVIQVLSDVVTLYPDSVGLFETLGRLHYKEQNYAEAITTFDTVLKLQPNDASGWVLRGHAKYAKRDYDNALVDLDTALQHQPDNGLAHYGRGLVYSAQNKPAEAVAAYQKALSYWASVNLEDRDSPAKEMRDYIAKHNLPKSPVI